MSQQTSLNVAQFLCRPFEVAPIFYFCQSYFGWSRKFFFHVSSANLPDLFWYFEVFAKFRFYWAIYVWKLLKILIDVTKTFLMITNFQAKKFSSIYLIRRTALFEFFAPLMLFWTFLLIYWKQELKMRLIFFWNLKNSQIFYTICFSWRQNVLISFLHK